MLHDCCYNNTAALDLVGSLLRLHTMYRKCALVATCPLCETGLLGLVPYAGSLLAQSADTIDDAHADLSLRLQVLVGLAKTCPRALAPHLAAMATKVQEMWQQGLLWAGERNVLCDGLVITAGTDSPSVQSQVGSQSFSMMLHVQVCLLAGSLLRKACRASFCQRLMPGEQDGELRVH